MKSDLDKAKAIAERVHGTQKDKKKYPYMAHVLDVSQRVQEFGDDYIIVALLHDVIEDAKKHEDGEKFQEIILSEIKDAFSLEVVEAVMAMTKFSSDDYFEDYLPRVKKIKLQERLKSLIHPITYQKHIF